MGCGGQCSQLACQRAGAAAEGYLSHNDALNRLTEFQDGQSGAAIETYGYDATGNRMSFTNAIGTLAYNGAL